MKSRFALVLVLALALLASVALLLWPSTSMRPTASGDEAGADLEAAKATTAIGVGAGAPTLDGGVPAVHAEEEAVLAPLDCSAPQGDVATVDGKGIGAAEFCAEWQRVSGPLDRGDPVVMDRQGRALLERMIDAHLVQRALAAANRAVTDRVVNEAFDALIAKRAKGQAQPEGSDAQHLREELRQQLGVRRLVELRGVARPTEAEVETAYAADPTRWGTPRSATVDAFLARAAPSASASTRADALAHARAFAEAVPGGDAAQLATLHGLSHVPQFEVASTSVEPQLAVTAFGLQDGAWSQPVQSRAGWMVLRVVKTKAGKAPPLSDVRAQVEELLVNQRKATEPQRLLASLRAEAKIVQLQW